MRILPLLLGALAVVALAGPATKTLSNTKKGKWQAKGTYPQFGGSGTVSKLADKTIAAAAKSMFAGFLKEANEALGQHVPTGPYSYVSTFTVSTQTTTVISAYSATYQYTGGAHGMSTYGVFNFGMVGGRAKQLKLKDLFKAGVNPVPDISTAIIAKTMNNPAAEWVKSGEYSAVSAQQAEIFVITKTGLLFLFDQYILGPYSSGQFKVLVPYSELSGLDPNGPVKGLVK